MRRHAAAAESLLDTLNGGPAGRRFGGNARRPLVSTRGWLSRGESTFAAERELLCQEEAPAY